MTIEECLSIADASLVITQVDDAHFSLGIDKEKLRAALLALVAQARDEEAEACAKVCDARGANFYSESPFAVEMHALAEAIRARIAARAEGGKHE